MVSIAGQARSLADQVHRRDWSQGRDSVSRGGLAGAGGGGAGDVVGSRDPPEEPADSGGTGGDVLKPGSPEGPAGFWGEGQAGDVVETEGSAGGPAGLR